MKGNYNQSTPNLVLLREEMWEDTLTLTSVRDKELLFDLNVQ